MRGKLSPVSTNPTWSDIHRHPRSPSRHDGPVQYAVDQHDSDASHPLCFATSIANYHNYSRQGGSCRSLLGPFRPIGPDVHVPGGVRCGQFHASRSQKPKLEVQHLRPTLGSPTNSVCLITWITIIGLQTINLTTFIFFFVNYNRYAKEIGPKIQSFFEDYFQIPFPLPKQDMIAIPDFSAGLYL